MGFRQGRKTTNQRAVSPVIGVILMVAMVVILAAVIGTFSFGFTDSLRDHRQASFDFDFTDTSSPDPGNDDAIVITHRGGAGFSAAEITVEFIDIDLEDHQGQKNPTGTFYPKTSWTGDGVTVGSTLTVDNEVDLEDADGNTVQAGDLVLNGATVRIIWTPPRGPPVILAEWEGPAA